MVITIAISIINPIIELLDGFKEMEKTRTLTSI